MSSNNLDLRTITFKISRMHCVSCALNIDFELEDLEGIKEAKTHYAQETSIVSFDSKEVTPKQIIAAITRLGYEAVVQNEK